ncbi:MAG: VCBS repeat-containing protein [Desulfamplus sp.]|nr:VCBS repeat-containing protein [Desulfamplus sp.]
MKIASSQLALNAERKYEEGGAYKREIEILPERAAQFASKRSDTINSTRLQDRVNIKSPLFPSQIDVPKNSSSSSSDDATPADPKLAAMKRMLDALMGKKFKLSDISGFERGADSSLFSTPKSLQTNPLQLDTSQFASIEIPPRRVRITEFNSYYESESSKFNASGVVKTESGETINFALNLDMKREFYTESKRELIGDASTLIDPLVINFSGKPAELSDVKFKFDLNSDGKDEDLSWLSSGSGFLVFDKNQDGVINSGSEMFGPTTNNGFSELSELDDDKNGWIDENDAAFEKLSVWSGDSPDTATLKSLKESNVGAIALSNEQTEFTIKDQKSQNTLGQIRRTGIYLDERSGQAGTIQQLDLAI